MLIAITQTGYAVNVHVNKRKCLEKSLFVFHVYRESKPVYGTITCPLRSSVSLSVIHVI